MKIDIVSDLHLDHRSDLFDWGWYKSPDSTVLIVAGDVTNSFHGTIANLALAARYYNRVFFVDGNHEFYQPYNPLKFSERENQFYDELHRGAEDLKNVEYLNYKRPVVEYNGVIFAGVNGWYDFKCYPDISFRRAKECWFTNMNDYRLCKFDDNHWHPEALAKRDITALERSLLRVANINKLIIITHTIPTVKLINESLMPPSWRPLTPSFCNSEAWNTLKSFYPDYWIYGHTHFRNDQKIDETRFICNALGYPLETKEPFKMVQIDV